MKTTDYITVTQLCTLYEVKSSFITTLKNMGLVQIKIIKETPHIHREVLHDIERMIRLHRELRVNPEGIDVIFNLLEKVDRLNEELRTLRNRLSLYEPPY